MLCEAANELRRVLCSAGAEIHSAVQVAGMAAMGGGVGVVAGAALQPGTRLVHFPERCILTVRKAARGLAELELEARTRLHGPGTIAPHQPLTSASITCRATRANATRLAARTTEDVQSSSSLGALQHTMVGKEGTSSTISSSYSSLSSERSEASGVDELANDLRRRLGPTRTMVCYLMVMAAQCGRWGSPSPSLETSCAADTALCGPGTAALASWMPRWLRALPTRVDNLLELAAALQSRTPMSLDAMQARPGRLAERTTPYLFFARHRAKVEQEWADFVRRYEESMSVLRALSLAHTSLIRSRSKEEQQQRYLWGMNMLLSRGFAYDVDTWAMMPYVDYFNYALEANATMHTEAAARCTRRTLRPAYVDEYNYTFITIAPVAQGEQLYLSYGAYSDYELLLWYGFTLRPVLLPVAPCAALHAALAALPDAPVLQSKSTDCHKVGANVTTTTATITADDDRFDCVMAASPACFAALHAEMDGLRRTMPYLCAPHTRRVLYAMLRNYEGEQAQGDAAIAAAKELYTKAQYDATGHTTGEAGTCEVAYETWCTALQRAFSFEFGPMADAEGVYATSSGRGAQDWMSELVTRYLETVQHSRAEENKEGADAVLERTTQEVAHAWQRTWQPGLRRCHTSDTHFTLGCLGPSRAMKTWCKALVRVAKAAATGSQTLSNDGMVDGVVLVRSLAWMELRVNAACHAAMPAANNVEVERMRVSRMARLMSADAYVLLRFLALDASDELLAHYWHYSPSY